MLKTEEGNFSNATLKAASRLPAMRCRINA
jgi:hypothetical protein